MIAYKVFTVSNGRLLSMAHYLLPSAYKVTWRERQTHIASLNSYFFIFERLRDARRWINDSHNTISIWRVKAEDTISLDSVPRLIVPDIVDILHEFWQAPRHNIHGVLSTPCGTRGARKVTLLEEIR